MQRGLLTSVRDFEFSESVHKRELTTNRLVLSRSGPPERASKEESHSASPHLVSVRLVRAVERVARVRPVRPSRNR
jgi:hypothetical protein